jgi:hypothetical protein
MANGGHEADQSNWRLAASILSFATAAWSALRGLRSAKPEQHEHQNLLERLAAVEQSLRDVREEAREDRQTADRRHEELIASLAKLNQLPGNSH